MTQDKLWTRTFIVLMGVNFCSALSFYLIMVKIAEFAVDTYGLPQSVAGTTITAYVIAVPTSVGYGASLGGVGCMRGVRVFSRARAKTPLG